MTSVSEFIASRIDCCKHFSSLPRTTRVTGICCTLNLSAFSQTDEQAVSYTGRGGKGKRSYVSARHDLERAEWNEITLSRCDSWTQVWLLCNVSTHCGAQRWHVATPCSKKRIWSKRCSWFMPAIGQYHAICWWMSSSRRLCPPEWGRASAWRECAWENGNFCMAYQLSLPCTARFCWTVHSSVCFLQDVFSHQAG